jgi:hypothetical protein
MEGYMMQHQPSQAVGQVLTKLVRKAADSLHGGFPKHPIDVDEEPPRCDGRYYYITVRLESLAGTERRSREIRLSADLVPENPRALLAGGLQQPRGPGGEARLVPSTPSDRIHDLLRSTLVTFIDRDHNVGYIEPDQAELRTYSTCLTPQEALDVATVDPSGRRRATGRKENGEHQYQAIRSADGSDETWVRNTHGMASRAGEDDLLGVDWEPEQIPKVHRLP